MSKLQSKRNSKPHRQKYGIISGMAVQLPKGASDDKNILNPTTPAKWRCLPP